MPKVSPEKWAELESFWRHHHEGWKQSPLNQREYCELHGLPLKRFGNWRDRFKAEDKVRQAGLLYRRGGLGHVSGHVSDREPGPLSTGYVPSARAAPEMRRNFRPSDEKRIVAEAMAPGASVGGVARRYGIDRPLLCRWKRELAPAEPAPVFLPVTVSDRPSTAVPPMPAPPTPAASAAVIIERPRDDIEVELTGGRRLCFTSGTDPEAVRTMIDMLEGAG